MTEKQIIEWVDFMDKSMDEYNSTKETLCIKFGNEPRPNDIIWRMFNDKTLEISIGEEQNRKNRLITNYHLMANFLLRVEGKNPFELIKQARQIELTEFQEVGIYTKVRIMTFHEGLCSTAKKLRNKIYKLSDVINEMPVPSPQCKNIVKSVNSKIPYCTCCYCPLMDDELF